MITMDDIVRDTDNNPVLRTRAAKVDFPLSAENQQLAQQLMEYLENSQNEEIPTARRSWFSSSPG